MKLVVVFISFAAFSSLLASEKQGIEYKPVSKSTQPAPDFRVVTNQVFNVNMSQAFEQFVGQWTRIVTNGVVIVKKSRWVASSGPSSSGVRVGNFIGTSGRPSGYWAGTDNEVVLQNFFASASTPKFVYIKAIHLGTTNIAGTEYDLWDCGVPVKSSKVPAGTPPSKGKD